jgi:hypothetical protein
MHHNVRPQLQWLLKVWRGKCVVDDDERPCRVRQIHDRGDVGDRQQWIGRSLDPHRLGLARCDGRGDRVKVGQMRRIGRNTPALMYPREQPVGAAVGVVGHHEMAPRSGDGPQQGVLGRQATGKRQPMLAPFKRRHALLESRTGRIGRARVFETATRLPDLVLDKRRRGINRWHH